MELAALDKAKGLTLDQLATFIQVAMRNDADPDARVRVTAGIRGQIKVIKIEQDKPDG
jgi:hypothetical protein